MNYQKKIELANLLYLDKQHISEQDYNNLYKATNTDVYTFDAAIQDGGVILHLFPIKNSSVLSVNETKKDFPSILELHQFLEEDGQKITFIEIAEDFPEIYLYNNLKIYHWS